MEVTAEVVKISKEGNKIIGISDTTPSGSPSLLQSVIIKAIEAMSRDWVGLKIKLMRKKMIKKDGGF